MWHKETRDKLTETNALLPHDAAPIHTQIQIQEWIPDTQGICLHGQPSHESHYVHWLLCMVLYWLWNAVPRAPYAVKKYSLLTFPYFKVIISPETLQKIVFMNTKLKLNTFYGLPNHQIIKHHHAFMRQSGVKIMEHISTSFCSLRIRDLAIWRMV